MSILRRGGHAHHLEQGWPRSHCNNAQLEYEKVCRQKLTSNWPAAFFYDTLRGWNEFENSDQTVNYLLTLTAPSRRVGKDECGN